MIEISTLAQTVAAVAADPVPLKRAAAPDAAARFAELMAQDAAPAASLHAVAPAQAPAQAPASPALSPVAESIAGIYPPRPATLGDQVLQGLHQVQNDFQGHVAAVGRMLAPGAAPLGVPELLRLQLGMAQLAVQVEVVGKAIGRSTQNIDQLVRMQ
ncbi:type III secretion system inner rod subunit SctI [Aquabacterium sp.]|uniref:type III secretion system inner rod subunit SctI n=1 Tax=Aquabacterium sp. TaxID=1872578 RepID=UPI002C431121|nr:type III secretion system inner rod subunit SctI [Aquabacterium sp.]HSW06936.1 type III secretion system inner rod subunit SctI [Aquabacterium sp.]